MVRRSPTPNAVDARGKQVTLTDAGRAAVDAALPDHVAAEHAQLAALDDGGRNTLAALLAKLDT